MATEKEAAADAHDTGVINPVSLATDSSDSEQKNISTINNKKAEASTKTTHKDSGKSGLTCNYKKKKRS